MFGDCFGTKIPESGQVLPGRAASSASAPGFALTGAVFFTAAAAGGLGLRRAAFFAVFFADAFFVAAWSPPSAGGLLRGGRLLGAGFWSDFAAGFLVGCLLRGDRLLGRRRSWSPASPASWSRSSALRLSPECRASWSAAAFLAAPALAGAFFAVAAGAFRALVDLPVAFAIGRSLRSLRCPGRGKAGNVTRPGGVEGNGAVRVNPGDPVRDSRAWPRTRRSRPAGRVAVVGPSTPSIRTRLVRDGRPADQRDRRVLHPERRAPAARRWRRSPGRPPAAPRPAASARRRGGPPPRCGPRRAGRARRTTT